ncbi:hypothetical protein IWQ60_008664 [Tieghemiomyces parasiticus]|uniref:Uncharacterized protein n=1 Tax=Tieghemiomyces parasiticus TaxID=78921 RepID=A0A9W7ZRZ4_9FUNG|nr:hypothetical protein IWQ60_008664 [Tieghemiomyces parasiticus]
MSGPLLSTELDTKFCMEYTLDSLPSYDQSSSKGSTNGRSNKITNLCRNLIARSSSNSKSSVNSQANAHSIWGRLTGKRSRKHSASDEASGSLQDGSGVSFGNQSAGSAIPGSELGTSTDGAPPPAKRRRRNPFRKLARGWPWSKPSPVSGLPLTIPVTTVASVVDPSNGEVNFGPYDTRSSGTSASDSTTSGTGRGSETSLRSIDKLNKAHSLPDVSPKFQKRVKKLPQRPFNRFPKSPSALKKFSSWVSLRVSQAGSNIESTSPPVTPHGSQSTGSFAASRDDLRSPTSPQYPESFLETSPDPFTRSLPNKGSLEFSAAGPTPLAGEWEINNEIKRREERAKNARPEPTPDEENAWRQQLLNDFSQRGLLGPSLEKLFKSSGFPYSPEFSRSLPNQAQAAEYKAFQALVDDYLVYVVRSMIQTIKYFEENNGQSYLCEAVMASHDAQNLRQFPGALDPRQALHGSQQSDSTFSPLLETDQVVSVKGAELQSIPSRPHAKPDNGAAIHSIDTDIATSFPSGLPSPTLNVKSLPKGRYEILALQPRTISDGMQFIPVDWETPCSIIRKALYVFNLDSALESETSRILQDRNLMIEKVRNEISPNDLNFLTTW